MVAEGSGGPPVELIERAVAIIMRTNRCDARAAREILTLTAERNRLAEVEVAGTLVALSGVPRQLSRRRN